MELRVDNAIEILFQSDNQRRQEAQKFVDQLPINNFDQGIEAFLMTMNHQNTQIATMAALLLKKKYLQPQEIASKLSISKMQYILKSVQACMQPQKPVLFLRRCCDIMVKIYNRVNQQKQLITLIQAMAGNEAHNIKMALYYLIQIICQCSFDDKLLIEYSGALETIFQKGLMEQNNQIKMSAFKTLTIFLASITDDKLVKKFQAVLQILITKAIQLIKYDQESGVTALQSLNQLIDTHPKFVKPVIPSLLSIYTQIMQTSALLINLRITSMYGLLMICINQPSTVRKSEYFKTKTIPAYMKMLSQPSSISMDEWCEQLNDQIISKNDISLSTQEHLGHILKQLTNKFMLPLFIPYIQKYLTSARVEDQHAGLTAMAIMTEQCHESFKGNLNNIVELIIPLMKTQHPKIMHDVILAIGYMSEEFGPELQQNYGDMILEFIIKCLQYPALKVQYKAVACLQNFEKGLAEHKEVKVMQKYLQRIMQEIIRIFEYSVIKMNFMLIETVLETIASLAQMNPFQNYYPVIMPGLKKLLGMIGSENPQKIMIKSKTVQTIGYLLASVKDTPSIFEADCKQIMQNMLKMTLTMQPDDPMHKAIYVVYQNVVTSIKQNFAMYAQHIYPLIIQSANRKIEFTIIEEGEISKTENLKKNKHNYAAYKLDLKVDGVKNLVLNTDNLAQKIQATNLIVQMAEDMKGAFAGYIEATLPTIKELISYKHNKQIRSNMIQTIKFMLLDCTNSQQKTFIVNQTYESVCNQLSNIIKQKDPASMANIIEVMSEMMPFMNQEMVGKMPNMMGIALSLIKNQTAVVEKEYGELEMDETLEEQLGDQIAEIEESLEHVEKIINMGKGINGFQQLKTYFPSDYKFEN